MAAKAKTKQIQPSSLVDCHLQVIGTGGGEVPPCLFLFTDSRRYLFNCGESVQRLCHEHKVKVSKLQDVFVTRVTWDNLGGLPGLAMTLRDIGLAKLGIHGCSSLEGFVSATRLFLSKEKIKLQSPEECTSATLLPDATYSDENVTIKTVELTLGEQYGSAGGQSDSDSDPSQGPQVKKAKSFSKCTSTAAFVCKLVDIPGKFNPQRALELGLSPGPIYKALVNGKAVTTQDGRVIQPSDIVGPTQKGPTFIILECPQLQFISLVTTHPLLQPDAFISTGQSVALIAHIAPPEVLDDEQYCKWMASFRPDTKHLVLNSTLCPSEVGIRAALKIQCPLHLLNPSVHHAPPTPEPRSDANADLKVFKIVPRESIMLGQTFMKYHLKPVAKSGVDISSVLRPLREDIAEKMAAIQSNPKLTHAILHPDKCSVVASSNNSNEPLEAEIQGTDILEQLPLLPIPSHTQPTTHLHPEDALITFLGTGASVPSKYRNVSGILVQTPSSGHMLLDCGEGTLSQIYRCFGQQHGDDIIRNLRTVFISHIHGDHHLGLISVLQRREKVLGIVESSSLGAASKSQKEEKTMVVGPVYLRRWLKEYRMKCERVSYKYVDSSTVMASTAGDSLKRGECQIQTVPVIHCKEAYGVILEHKRGWKIVYSGDTRPCSRLVHAGKDATLLVHEATFEDDLYADAQARNHSTISEALDIAKQMSPDFTILTHFSQRYPKVPQLLLTDDCLKSKVTIAFDCMSVRLKELQKLPSFLPAMKEIFAEDFEQDDANTTPVYSW